MLELEIPIGQEGWDPVNEEFIDPEVRMLRLEHSLVSLSKWESKWCKPFLANEEKTAEETLDYIKCMALDEDIDSTVYSHLTPQHVDRINEYIKAPMTATTFREDKGGKGSREIVTAELIYYWMVALNIPFECQEWHLNKLLTLIRVCNIKNAPPKKMSKAETMARNKNLNAIRRAEMERLKGGSTQ